MIKFIAYILCTTIGLILMKLSGTPIEVSLTRGTFGFNIDLIMVLALCFYGASFFLWTGIVAKNDLSFIVPLSTAIVNVISVGAGIMFFKDTVSIHKIAGICMAVAGVYLINLSK